MSENLLTLTQDEIDRWEIKGKVPGDTITASEYSKLQKDFEANRNKKSSTEDKKSSTEDTSDKKTSKK
jgi:hypothetical protein